MATPLLQLPPPSLPAASPAQRPDTCTAQRPAGGVVGAMHTSIIERLGLPPEAFIDESDGVERFVAITSRLAGYATMLLAIAGLAALIV